MSDDLNSKANASALEIGAEAKTHPDVADDDYTADALRALAALGAHGEDQIKVMLQLGGAVARAKLQLKHGDFTRWCEDTLKRKATWCSAHRRLFEIQEDIEPARAWAKETNHRWADCFSVERLLKLVAESKKAKRTDNATNDIPPAPKARRKLTDVLAELAQAQERIAQDDADFVSLRDELSPEDDAGQGIGAASRRQRRRGHGGARRDWSPLSLATPGPHRTRNVRRAASFRTRPPKFGRPVSQHGQN